MSKLYYHGNDIYEDSNHFLLDRPLDTARLTYAKLRGALSEFINVEVLWDHFHNMIVVLVGANKDFEENGYSMSFKDSVMARTDRIAFIDQLVNEVKEAEEWLRALQQF